MCSCFQHMGMYNGDMIRSCGLVKGCPNNPSALTHSSHGTHRSEVSGASKMDVDRTHSPRVCWSVAHRQTWGEHEASDSSDIFLAILITTSQSNGRNNVTKGIDNHTKLLSSSFSYIFSPFHGTVSSDAIHPTYQKSDVGVISVSVHQVEVSWHEGTPRIIIQLSNDGIFPFTNTIRCVLGVPPFSELETHSKTLKGHH